MLKMFILFCLFMALGSAGATENNIIDTEDLFSRFKSDSSSTGCRGELIEFPEHRIVRLSRSEDKNIEPRVMPKPSKPVEGEVAVLLQILKEAKLRRSPMNREMLEKQLRAFEIFVDRVKKNFRPLNSSEIKMYAELLHYAAMDIFYQHKIGENPLSVEVLNALSMTYSRYSGIQKYNVVTGFLAGLDLNKATDVDPTNYISILWYWDSSHHAYQRASLNPTWDLQVDHKINQLISTRPDLKKYGFGG